VIGGDFRADRDHRVLADAEFRDLALRLDLGDGEIAALGLGDVLHLAAARSELQRDVAVLLFGTVADDLTIGEPQHRHRHVRAGLGEDPCHSDLLCDHTGTHESVLDS
jgi:hypothetical protein